MAVKHRRSGKTVAAVNELIKNCLTATSFMPAVAYVAPLRNQAKRIAWPFFKYYCQFIPGATINAGDLEVHLPGDRRIYVLGADNPDVLRGVGLDDCVIDETAQINPEVWYQVIRPALAERKGRVTFIGTPKGRLNLFHTLYELAPTTEGWSASMLRASESGILPDSELADLRKTMPENEYNQEFECSFNAAITGAFYAREMVAVQNEGRVGAWKHDKTLPTVAALDLGWADTTVVWIAQVDGNQVRVIRCRGYQHTSLVDVIGDIRTWGWPIHRFIVPHDIQVTEFSSGVSRQQLMAQQGCSLYILPNGSLVEGIDAVRNLLPRCAFDREDCRTGVEALVQYRSKHDPLLQTQSKNPVHDWASHWADGFRYLAIGILGGAHKGYDPEAIYNRRRYRRGI